MRIFLTFIGAIALAACSDAGAPEASSEPAETKAAVEADGGIDDGESDLASTKPANETGEAVAASAIGPNTIPPDYRGVWDYVEGTCARESDLRVEIAGDRMTFYESVGRVTKVEAQSNGDKIVTLAMSGEGETWEQRLRLEMDSTAMRMVLSDPAGSPGPTDARKRCM